MNVTTILQVFGRFDCYIVKGRNIRHVGALFFTLYYNNSSASHSRDIENSDRVVGYKVKGNRELRPGRVKITEIVMMKKNKLF